MDAAITSGPFSFGSLSHRDRGWEIVGADGVRLCTITAVLIDGSGTRKWQNNEIRSRDTREREAQYVLDALNAAWAVGKRP